MFPKRILLVCHRTFPCEFLSTMAWKNLVLIPLGANCPFGKHFHSQNFVSHCAAFESLSFWLLSRVELERSTEKFDIIIGDLADPVEGGPCYKLYTKVRLLFCHSLLP